MLHVHAGFLVKIAEEVAYQVDVRPGDVLHWVTDLGWIMGPWEIVGALALGSTVLLTEGAPNLPGPDRLWETVERHGVTTLGVLADADPRADPQRRRTGSRARPLVAPDPGIDR